MMQEKKAQPPEQPSDNPSNRLETETVRGALSRLDSVGFFKNPENILHFKVHYDDYLALEERLSQSSSESLAVLAALKAIDARCNEIGWDSAAYVRLLELKRQADNRN